MSKSPAVGAVLLASVVLFSWGEAEGQALFQPPPGKATPKSTEISVLQLQRATSGVAVRPRNPSTERAAHNNCVQEEMRAHPFSFGGEFELTGESVDRINSCIRGNGYQPVCESDDDFGEELAFDLVIPVDPPLPTGDKAVFNVYCNEEDLHTIHFSCDNTKSTAWLSAANGAYDYANGNNQVYYCYNNEIHYLRFNIRGNSYDYEYSCEHDLLDDSTPSARVSSLATSHPWRCLSYDAPYSFQACYRVKSDGNQCLIQVSTRPL